MNERDPIGNEYPLVARSARPKGATVRIGHVVFGGPEIVLMAGPCCVESESQIQTTARAVAEAGGSFLRGGAFKPSTSPYSFQGLGEPGLQLMREAADAHGLLVVTEVMDPRKVDLVSRYADMLQIGTRNMQNFDLLKEVGLSGKPVLLKRGMNAQLHEWLLAAEYVSREGNEQIVMCERGIRTFEPHTRNTLDLSAVPALHDLTHLPVVVDPSHGTGRRELVGDMSLAAVAAGADGLLIEVHPSPNDAWKDGAQSLSLSEFAELAPKIELVARAVGRSLETTRQTV